LSIVETNYFKVDVEYLQRSQLLVVAKSAENAAELVQENVLDTTEGFKILGVSELSDEEKAVVIKSMMGLPEDDEDVASADPKTLN
jgi:hypothetical protein